MRNCYTFVIDYNGGTYLRQVQARGIRESLRRFTISIRADKHIEFGSILSKELSDKMAVALWPVPVDGLIGVWCISCSVMNKLALLNIIRMSPEVKK